MWPKRNYELGYGTTPNSRFRGHGGGGGLQRRASISSYNVAQPAIKGPWGPRPAARKFNNNRNRFIPTASPKFASSKKAGTKRQLAKTDTSQGPSSQAKKRKKSNEQKLNDKKLAEANHAQLPLTTIILARPGDKSGTMPELVFNGFYDCSKEAKLGRKTHYLRLNVTKKPPKTKKQAPDEKAEDRISIPVPLSSIAAVSVISGMNPFEDMMKAHASTIALQVSMEHWRRVIDRRTEAMEKKKKELEDLSEVEDYPEDDDSETSEVEVVDLESSEEEEEEDETEEEETPKKRSKRKKISPAEAKKAEAEKIEKAKEAAERKRLAKEKRAEEKKLAKEKKIAEKEERKKHLAEMKKKKATLVRKRNVIKASVVKLEAAVEKAKQGLRSQENKLEKITKTFGEELAYFQNTMAENEAFNYFADELKQGVNFNLEDESEGNDDEEMKEPSKKSGEGADIEMLDPQSGVDENIVEDEASERELICSSCGAKQTEKKKFCGDCGAKQEEKSLGKIPKKKIKVITTIPKESSVGKISDIPVWIAISLTNPLEKFYASDANTEICERDVLEKAELILLKFHPKHRSRIVLKNVTYEGAEEHLKLLNEVFEGPWKSLRVSQNDFLKDRTPYSLEKTLRYLTKRHTRQTVTDNTLERCELCDKEFKHVLLKKHRTHFCPMRKEPCSYCEVVIVVSQQKEHEETCLKFPMECPQKCSYIDLQRCQVEEHLKTCENSIVECEFKHAGCNTKYKRKDTGIHLQDNAVKHVQLLNSRILLMSTYFLRKDPELEKLIRPTPPSQKPEEKEKDTDENEKEEKATERRKLRKRSE